MAVAISPADKAIFKQGSPVMVDITPTSAVPAGAVYSPNEGTSPVPYVAHTAIAANEKGAVAAGGGVYEMISDGSVDAGGVSVYWDDSADKVTTTATDNAHFGFSMPDQGATDDGDSIRVLHWPAAVAVAT